MRFDFWRTKREAAEVIDYGIRVQREDSPPVATIWTPKAEKPCANFRFRSLEARDKYVADFVANFAEQQRAKVQRARERRKSAAELGSNVQVGHVFRYSWGYDQTNVQYFQVVEKHGGNVVVREIAQSAVPGSEGFMCERVEPRIGHFLEKAEPLTKRVQFTNDGRAYLSFEFGWCELWRGGSDYRSWYA